MKNNNQHGFTLIELMIAIVLGLLITAAAIQLFITGQISINTQKGMAEIQESGNFGLRYITSDIRRASACKCVILCPFTQEFANFV